MNSTIRRFAAALGLATGLTVIAATAAGATIKPPPQPKPLSPNAGTSVTRVKADPDSGGNGNWANDWFTRTLNVYSQGTVASSNCAGIPGFTPGGTCTAYTATIKDSGLAWTIPGAFAPNQGAGDTGALIHSHVKTSMDGYGDFDTFYADAGLSVSHANRGVPPVIVGAPSSSVFPERMFPAGSTTLDQASTENVWSYRYAVTLTHRTRVWVHHHWVTVIHRVRQSWVDGYNNSGGQVPAAGQITG